MQKAKTLGRLHLSSDIVDDDKGLPMAHAALAKPLLDEGVLAHKYFIGVKEGVNSQLKDESIALIAGCIKEALGEP